MCKKFFIIIIIILIFLHGCNESVFEMIYTVDAEPETSKPRINHFLKEDVITIEWDKDILADEYILYRDNTPNGLFNNIVYQGTALRWEDKNVENGYFYYYKLAKKRGLKYFPKSDYVYGVCSDIIKDCFEDNNNKGSNNYILDTSLGANIYYFRDTEGNEIIDTDWYKIDLGPKTYLHLIVRFLGDQSTDRYTVLCNNDISLRPEKQPNQLIEDAEEFKIYNTSNYIKTVYFQICVEPNTFLFNSRQVGNGQGKIGYYTLTSFGIFSD